MQEAIELERQAHLQDKERQERIAEKKKRLGMTTQGEVLTRQEREARIWAYMYVSLTLSPIAAITLYLGTTNQPILTWKTMMRMTTMTTIHQVGLKMIKMMVARGKTLSTQTSKTFPTL